MPAAAAGRVCRSIGRASICTPRSSTTKPATRSRRLRFLRDILIPVSGANIAAATEVGRRVAEAAVAAGVTRVVFDRGGFLFHGRVKALAEAARAAGLEF